MTWFGWIMVVLASIAILSSASGDKTDEQILLSLVINGLWLAGTLFVGTGHI